MAIEKIVEEANSLIYRLTTEVNESEEEFIFTTIADFLEHKTERRVSKKELIEAIKAYREYRWHDLRENPEDLPPRNLPVEIRTSPHGNLFTAIFDDEKQDIITNWTFRYNNCTEDTDIPWDMDTCVTAWRYIEPFNEIENIYI